MRRFLNSMGVLRAQHWFAYGGLIGVCLEEIATGKYPILRAVCFCLAVLLTWDMATDYQAAVDDRNLRAAAMRALDDVHAEMQERERARLN